MAKEMVGKKAVMVYEDPITRQKEEGLATVIRKIGSRDAELGQQCVVHFVGDPSSYQVQRWVWGV